MANEIMEIRAYKTSDGNIFEDKDTAIKKQQDINLRAVFTEIVGDSYYSHIRSEDLVNVLMENIDKIKKRYLHTREPKINNRVTVINRRG